VQNPSDAACGDLPPDTPVEFRLMSVLTEEMKIQSPGIPNIDSGARFTPEGGDVNPAETNGPTDVPIVKGIHDHQRSMSLAEDSPNAVFDLVSPGCI